MGFEMRRGPLVYLIAFLLVATFAIGFFLGDRRLPNPIAADNNLTGTWRAKTNPYLKLVFDSGGTYFLLSQGRPILGARRWYVQDGLGFFEMPDGEGKSAFDPKPYKITDDSLSFEDSEGFQRCWDFVRDKD